MNQSVDIQSYGFDSDYQAIYDAAFRYAKDQLYPLAERMDEEDWFPESDFRELARQGLLGVTVPSEYGGAELDVLAQCFICEAVAYWNHAFAAGMLASDNLCLDNIVRNANEDQKKSYLPGFCDGSTIGALGMTEPGAGSDALGSMSTTAVRDGDDYILNGRKLFITNGPVADILLVYAKTDMEKKQHGISAFIVEKNFKGFSVAQNLNKMGWRGSPTAELVFDNCRVPAGNLLGLENKGNIVMMSGLDVERVIAAFFGLGQAHRALDLALEYAVQRKQFGAPIGTFQIIQGMLADMYTELESMRALTYQLGREIKNVKNGETGRGNIHKRSAAALLAVGKGTMKILDQAVQIHGGMGFMRETEVNRLYRSGKVLEIAAGSNQVRQIIIAEQILSDAGL